MSHLPSRLGVAISLALGILHLLESNRCCVPGLSIHRGGYPYMQSIGSCTDSLVVVFSVMSFAGTTPTVRQSVNPAREHQLHPRRTARETVTQMKLQKAWPSSSETPDVSPKIRIINLHRQTHNIKEGDGFYKLENISTPGIGQSSGRQILRVETAPPPDYRSNQTLVPRRFDRTPQSWILPQAEDTVLPSSGVNTEFRLTFTLI
ncbi:uncharacterized protein CLUP02_14320 [Colletotrichum lupini]|uniref:Uncharacterized protein n=1 Tax=Colletotrichum lupini TaxID=145971 RepID=A0A9Q8T4S7_9PEZI|nr:uncharacterized protein CLUP02_14320 [Colletotrichum lupini]UQC88795.1 hypothetical protein CLUP02_14320 [Colletotrichum lupini]